ncbi:MAG TPA: hypothetical protein DCL61_25530 [Cyanobacteria bacterium UBA12227]|nr:hypothetical protein [Cyanobacteria bacterium UBA12227]HAX90022.1 hypothetical protein [Cyanobacteria bacterium UBA11370]HBY80050.1 hypothetical protein [Cyanobacteria bacterium UBA11148]
MTSSIAKKFLFTPVVVSAAVFATLTLPLQLFGSQQVTFQLQEETRFFGQLEDFAPQYLSVAGVLSIGAGMISLAAMGWRQSSRKSAQVKNELSTLAQNLQEKQELLEALQQAKSEFDAFSDVKLDQLSSEELSQQPIPTFRQETQPQVKPFVITESSVTPSAVNVQAVAAKFTSAQTFFGYTQAKHSTSHIQSHIQPKDSVSPSSTPTSEVEKLDSELQEIMHAITSMRMALRTSHPQSVTSVRRQNTKTA